MPSIPELLEAEVQAGRLPDQSGLHTKTPFPKEKNKAVQKITRPIAITPATTLITTIRHTDCVTVTHWGLL